MNITIQSTRVDLSDEMRGFIRRKTTQALRALGQTRPGPLGIEVTVGQVPHATSQPSPLVSSRHYRVEAIVLLPDSMLGGKGSAGDLRTAVMQMKHDVARQIRGQRRRFVGRHSEPHIVRASVALYSDERDAL